MTKATASVRIAHESVLAATLQVAREKMQGISAGPPAHPDPDYSEELDWQALVNQGLVGHLRVSNAEIDDRFAGTVWADDDPEASDYPEETYLDLWVVDLGPPSVARAVLDEDTFVDLRRFMEISQTDEPILSSRPRGTGSSRRISSATPRPIGSLPSKEDCPSRSGTPISMSGWPKTCPKS